MTSAISLNDSLTSVVAGMGTSRDKSSTVTYTAPSLTDQEARNAYSGAWLPRKIVDQAAKDCFRRWRDWQGEADVIGRIEAEEKRLDLRAKFERAMILARLFGRGHVYFDLGDDPSTPANPARVKQGGLRFATVLSKGEIVDGDTDDDPMSPFYGSPRYYELSSPSMGIVRIHPSRLVTFWGDDDPRDMVFGREGQSVLKSAMPAIKRHDSTVANIAGLVFEARVDVITVPGLGELMADREQSQLLLDRFRLMATMKGNNGIVLLSGPNNKDLPGEQWDQKNTSFATLPNIIEKAQEEVSAAAGIPRAILFGVSGGGLGSTGDLELSNYYDTIATMQTNDIEPALRVIDECLIRSALGARPSELWYSWASLWQMTDKEKAEIGKIKADMVKTLVDAQVIPAGVLTKPTIAALTESGVLPGLDQAYEDWDDMAPSEDDLPEMPDDDNSDDEMNNEDAQNDV